MRVSSSKDLSGLEDSLGYVFKKKQLLLEAITHKSYSHEHGDTAVPFNERLEFLGDAVLELIVSEHIFKKYRNFDEAELSKIKSYAVQESTLAVIAKKLKIGSYLRLGKGEEMTGGRKKPSLLSNAFEAIIAAIFLDGGYRNAKKVIAASLFPHIEKLSTENFIFDFKTRFQEMSQQKFGVLPRYVIDKEEGPEHRKTFQVKVYIKNRLMGCGKGKTKKAAAQKAAEEGLKKTGDIK
jgi:ribonuclease-3